MPSFASRRRLLVLCVLAVLVAVLDLYCYASVGKVSCLMLLA